MQQTIVTTRAERAQIRRAMRDKRAHLSSAEQHDAARDFARHASSWPVFNKARNVAFYVATRGEIDPMPLARIALDQSKEVYLPVLCEEKRLRFRRWMPETRMVKNRFDISEPADDGTAAMAADQLDLVFVPLTAADRHGNRLGQGAGFYDRSFSFLNDNDSRGPVLAGAAYDFQLVDRLEPAPWDVPLRFIVTPSQLSNCREK